MTSVQIYTNTTSSYFATTNGSQSGTKTVAPLIVAADNPGSHLPQATKPDATSHPNSLFTGSGLNYLRIKLLTTGAATLSSIPQFYIYGWSRELTTGWWEARLLTSLKPAAAAIATTNAVNWPGVGSSIREIFALDSSVTAPVTTPFRGDSKIYQSFASGGGGHFLVDTIGTELIEIHVTQASATTNTYLALCAGI